MIRAAATASMLVVVQASCGDASLVPVDAPLAFSADAEATADPQPVSLRVVNLCPSAVDLYVADDGTPAVAAVAPDMVTTYVGAMVGGERGVFHVRRANDPADALPLASSDPVQPSAGDQATLAIRGASCAILPLWGGFGDTPEATLRIRFVDTSGAPPPIRLFMEQPDGTFPQIAAVDPLGGSAAPGVLVAAPPPGTETVNVQVDAELVATPEKGTPGYEIPAAQLRAGAKLFVFSTLTPTFQVVLVGEGQDAPFRVTRNPTVTVFNAVPDLCAGNAVGAHMAFRDGAGKIVGAVDAQFGHASLSILQLPPTATGHTIAVTPGAGCSDGGGGEAATGPLVPGGSYLALVFGSAAAGAIEARTLAGPPTDRSRPQVQLINIALGAPAIDVATDLSAADAGVGPVVFGAVPYGGSSDWIATPSQPQVVVVQRPSLKTTLPIASEYLFVIGDWRNVAATAVRLVLFAAKSLGSG